MLRLLRVPFLLRFLRVPFLLRLLITDTFSCCVLFLKVWSVVFTNIFKIAFCRTTLLLLINQVKQGDIFFLNKKNVLRYHKGLLETVIRRMTYNTNSDYPFGTFKFFIQTYNGRQNTTQKIEQRELHKKHGRTVAFRKSISSSCYLVVPVVLLLLQTLSHRNKDNMNTEQLDVKEDVKFSMPKDSSLLV